MYLGCFLATKAEFWEVRKSTVRLPMPIDLIGRIEWAGRQPAHELVYFIKQKSRVGLLVGWSVGSFVFSLYTATVFVR